jgi:tetratricopeptide (TPR) repeat protein
MRYGKMSKAIMASTQEQYDDAMFLFSRGEFSLAIARLKEVLAEEPDHFDAQLSLGMACYRAGDFSAAITEGHKAEKLRPHEQLVHTNLSLFYVKVGDKAKAEHHGLQARIASWREPGPGATGGPEAADPGLELAKPSPAPFKTPEKFPDMPWKKKTSAAKPPQTAEDP